MLCQNLWDSECDRRRVRTSLQTLVTHFIHLLRGIFISGRDVVVLAKRPPTRSLYTVYTYYLSLLFQARIIHCWTSIFCVSVSWNLQRNPGGGFHRVLFVSMLRIILAAIFVFLFLQYRNVFLFLQALSSRSCCSYPVWLGEPNRHDVFDAASPTRRRMIACVYICFVQVAP